MTTKPHRSVTLTAPQWDSLKAEAGRLGIAVSELLRRIVDERTMRVAQIAGMSDAEFDAFFRRLAASGRVCDRDRD